MLILSCASPLWKLLLLPVRHLGSLSLEVKFLSCRGRRFKHVLCFTQKESAIGKNSISSVQRNSPCPAFFPMCLCFHVCCSVVGLRQGEEFCLKSKRKGKQTKTNPKRRTDVRGFPGLGDGEIFVYPYIVLQEGFENKH